MERKRSLYRNAQMEKYWGKYQPARLAEEADLNLIRHQ